MSVSRFSVAIVLAAAAACVFAPAAQSAPITVVNPGFELPGAEINDGFSGTVDVPGWNQDGSVDDSGIESRGAEWAAYLNNNDPVVYQTLSHIIAAGDLFTIGFEAVDSFQGTDLTVSIYKLEADNVTRTTLASQVYAPLPQGGQFQAFSLQYTALAADAGRLLGIAFDNTTPDAAPFGNESWLNIDNFTADVAAIPEPASLGLVVPALTLLVRRRRAH